MWLKYVDNSKCRLRLYQSTVKPKRTEPNLFIRVGKSEAEVTNVKDKCARGILIAVEDNYRQTSPSFSATAELRRPITSMIKLNNFNVCRKVRCVGSRFTCIVSKMYKYCMVTPPVFLHCLTDNQWQIE